MLLLWNHQEQFARWGNPKDAGCSFRRESSGTWSAEILEGPETVRGKKIGGTERGVKRALRSQKE